MAVVKCLHCRKNFSIPDKVMERIRIEMTPQPEDPELEEELAWLNCELEKAKARIAELRGFYRKGFSLEEWLAWEERK